MWLTGPAAPRHVGSSQTRARTRVPCIGRQILNHCATREAPGDLFFKKRKSSAFEIMTLSEKKTMSHSSPQPVRTEEEKRRSLGSPAPFSNGRPSPAPRKLWITQRVSPASPRASDTFQQTLPDVSLPLPCHRPCSWGSRLPPFWRWLYSAPAGGRAETHMASHSPRQDGEMFWPLVLSYLWLFLASHFAAHTKPSSKGILPRKLTALREGGECLNSADGLCSFLDAIQVV